LVPGGLISADAPTGWTRFFDFPILRDRCPFDS
jgi:hypothetical protein